MLPVVLLLAAGCGPDNDTGAGVDTLAPDGADAAGSLPAPPAAAVGDRSPAATAAAEPPPPEQPAPRTRQQLIESSGAEPFERYLTGPWYREPRDHDTGADRQVEIIHFEPDRRHVTFFDGEVQEIYSWDGSERRTATRIAIRVHNAIVTSVTKTMVVEVEEAEVLQLQVWSSDSDDESDLNGSYRRLDQSARDDLVASAVPQPGLAELELSGLYQGSDGQTILFETPRFTWQQNGRSLTGGFAVYFMERMVIVFKFVSLAGTTSDTRAYALEFQEHRGSERVRRSLILHPATLEVTGLAAVSASALHFEQVELAVSEEPGEAGAEVDAGAAGDENRTESAGGG